MEEDERLNQPGNPYKLVNPQEMMDAVEDELLVIDGEYRIRFANATACAGFRKDVKSLVGLCCYEVIQGRDRPCSSPLWSCPLREVMRSGRPVTAIQPLHITGVDRYVKITAFPIHGEGENIQAIVELRRDVSAERELETQVLRRHHQLLALSHISNAVSGQRDLDTILKLALEDVTDLFPGAVGGILLMDEKTGTLCYRVQHGLSASYTQNRRISLGEGIAGSVAESGQSVLVEDVSKDPRAARPDLVNAEGVKGFISIPLKTGNRVVGVMNIFSHIAGRFGADDVSLLNSIGGYLGTMIEQTRLNERLARIGERYQALLRYSLSAQEQERKRIARELHDETAQSLTSLALSLQALIGLAEIKGFTAPDFMENLKKTHAYTVHAGKEIVKLMKELRPTLLDELGLPAAIHRYAKDTLQSHGVNMTAEFVGTSRRFPPEVEVSLFRLAQGAIGNIVEHSEAKNASIKLVCDQNECRLTIEDDGKGFDVSKLKSVDASGRGAGLFIMRERTSLLGGTGYVESAPGKGTKVIAKVPLERNAEDLGKDVVSEEDKSIDS